MVHLAVVAVTPTTGGLGATVVWHHVPRAKCIVGQMPLVQRRGKVVELQRLLHDRAPDLVLRQTADPLDLGRLNFAALFV